MNTNSELSPPSRDRIGGPQVKVVLEPSADGGAFDTWRQHLAYASIVELRDATTRPHFGADIAIYFLGDLMLSDTTVTQAHRVVRTSEDTARAPLDHVNIALHVAGRYAGEAAGKPFLAEGGDLSFIDWSAPYTIDLSPCRVIALSVPRKAMSGDFKAREFGFVVTPQHPAARLLAATLRGFVDLLPELTMAEAVAAAEGVVRLADAASQGQVDDGRKAASVATLRLFDRARAEIERSLGDADLSVDTVTKAIGISRTALYALFAEQGGVQAYIRERRLWRCYEIILQNLQPDRTIGAISSDFGFASEGHFSRTFKARFGLSPRAARAAGKRRGVAIEPSPTGGVPYLWRS